MITALKVAAFLRKHHAGCRRWPKQNLIAWLQWVWALDAVAVVTDRGRVTAVGIARPLLALEDAIDYYRWDKDGAILWVDMAVSLNPQATALLLRQANERWKERAFIAFNRSKWGRQYVLPWRNFMGRFKRKEN